jgi:uncharacterized Zn finger protein (UPF0148 family)
VTWQQLKDILKENQKDQEEVQRGKITQCPECDFPLRENKDRELLCPICGWRGNK